MSKLADIPTRSHLPTFDDLIAMAESDATLKERQRAAQATMLRRLVQIIARCVGAGPLAASTIPCDVAWLNDCVYRLPPKAHGLASGSFGNYVSNARSRLRQLGLLDPAFPVCLAKGSPWRPLLDGIKDAHCRYGLSKFAAWCDARGIPPTRVIDETDEILAAFEHHVRTRHLRDDIPGFIRNLVKSWRKAASLSASWPSARLAGPQRRHRYRFEISDFPQTVQDQVASYRRRLSGEGTRGPFRAEGPAKKLRRRSADARVYGVKLALNAHVEVRGLAPSAVTDLAQLIQLDAFQEILTFHWERAVQRRIVAGELDPSVEPEDDAGNTSQTAAVASALMIFAKYVCKLPTEELDLLRDEAALVRPEPQKTISRRNTAILDRLLEPTNRLALLHLPAKLMKAADALEGRPYRAALMAMTAVAIEIELNKPLRLMNLTELRLGEELQFTDPRSQRPTRLKIRRSGVKNDVDIEWPVSRQLGELIAHYMHHHRGKLGKADTAWLFPGRRSSDGPRHCDTIRRNIQTAIAEHVGVQAHVHIFRAFVGYLILKQNSGALEDVRQLLDHKTLDTCLAYYVYRQREEVAARVDQILERGRAGDFLTPPPKPTSPAPRRRR